MSNKVDKTKVISVFETFAGIGAQYKAIKNIDPKQKYFRVVKTSEWDARSIISYALIHHGREFNSKLKQISKWDDQAVNSFLSGNTYSLDSKKPASIVRKDREFKNNLIAATISNHNIPDITTVNGRELQDINLLTYSFPCQGLSIANMGRGRGIKESSDSTSKLIWEIKRILSEAIKAKILLPKYLLMENVVTLLNKNNIYDYEKWVKFLEHIGYKTYTLKLNGLDFGSIQKRSRIFAISIKSTTKKKWTDIELEKLLIEKYGMTLGIGARKKQYYRILSSSDKHFDEINQAIPNNTPSRIKMRNNNFNLYNWNNQTPKNKYIFRTLTCKQDRHPNIGMIPLSKNNINHKNGKLNARFITNREAYMIMGFESRDFDKVKKKNKIITNESLYRQAGNSIIVQILEALFNFINDYERGKYE